MEANIEGKKTVKEILKTFPRVFKLLFDVNKLYLMIVTATMLIKGILPTISIFLMQQLINQLSFDGGTFKAVLIVLSLYIVVDLISDAIDAISLYCSSKLEMDISLKINLDILNKTRNLDLKHFEDTDTYNKIKRAQNESNSRIFSYFMLYIGIIQKVITLVTTSFILVNWRWWSILIVIITPVLSSLVMVRFSKKQYKIYIERTIQERKRWYITTLLTNDTAFKEIKLYKLYEYFINCYSRITKDFIKKDTKLLKERTGFFILFQLLDELLLGSIMFLIIRSTFLKEIMVGNTIAYIRCISNIKVSVQSLLQNIISIYENSLYVDQLFSFLDMKLGDNISNEDVYIDDIEKIEVNNLSFKYPTAKDYSLKNINLSLAKNDMAAIVGRNGSGKTTLIKLISGFYDDYEGAILINGIPLKHINKERLRELIGAIYQDFIKYELTLRENVAMGKIDHIDNDEKILDALKQGNCDRVLGFMKDGIDSQIGFWFEDGIQLSGGEWQKIALSRAFIRDAKLYILDEPSSALDPVSEVDVLDKYSKLVSEKIGLMVTHRISNINRIANKIIVIDYGEIVDIGTHDQLVQRCNIYMELYYKSKSDRGDGEKVC